MNKKILIIITIVVIGVITLGVTMGFGATYDITQIDVLEFDTGNATWISTVMMDSTHPMIAYADNDSDGQLQTFSVDGAYDNIANIDTLQQDAANGLENSLVMIDSTHAILAYTGGTGVQGFIKTFSIDGSYDNITEIDSLNHVAEAHYNSLIMIDSTHFMLAYTDVDGDGQVKTFSIDGSYDNITEIDRFQFDNVNGVFSSLVKISATTFAVAYGGANGDGYIKTLSIDGSYNNIATIDTLEHDILFGPYNSLVLIDNTHLALAYASTGYIGVVKTFSIDGSADNIAQIDSLTHDATMGMWNSMVLVDSTHLLLAYSGKDNDGYIKTFEFDGAYDNITEIFKLEHDTARGYYNSLVKADASHYVLAYSGLLQDGYIKTFSIEIPTPPATGEERYIREIIIYN